jgi:signal transduction histidine kinase
MQLELEQESSKLAPPSAAPILRGMSLFLGVAAAISYAYVTYIALFTDRVQVVSLFIIPMTILIPYLLGQLILRQQPRHMIGWLFLCMALAATLQVIATAVEVFNELRPASYATWIDAVARNVEQVAWIPSVFIPLLVMPFYFPNGKLLSRYWRIPVVLVVTNLVWMVIAITLHPWPWAYLGVQETRVLNGIAGSESLIEAITWLLNLLMIPMLVVIPAALVFRHRRATDIEKLQLKWPLAATVVFFIFGVVITFSSHLQAFDAEHSYVFTWTAAMLFPLSVGIAILRYRLFDIDVFINRTLVYGILTAIIIGLYIGITSTMGNLIQKQTSALNGLIATAVVAVIFQPLRERLQRGVNSILYGKRDEPEAVLSQLAHQIEAADTSGAILSDLLRTTAITLKIPYVAILVSAEDDDLKVYTAWGKATAPQELLPLIFQNRTIGYLAVSPRGVADRFTARERSLLATVAALTATTFRGVQLSNELSRSRQRIVTAREEERRRIRRDLHDGLGPQLASQTLSLEAISQLIETDPKKARYLVGVLQTQSEEAMHDIRRLVYDLRPPALDNIGLAGALRQSALRYATAELQFSFEIGTLPNDLPAAVETAVYRIAQEAMTNVVRHAEASHCTIRLSCTHEDLVLEIQDDGRGLPDHCALGIGLHAMHERAAELNGETRVEVPPAGGALVRARLPLEIRRE